MDRFAVMEAFIRVVETGSFSGAARQLRVGQPSVSKMVSQLEGRLGVRLLLRSTHGLTITEAGQSYYERAKRALDEADEAEQTARGAGAALSGRLRICAAVTFARLHVIPTLPDFLTRHPDLHVDVVLDDRNVDLIEAGVDVALRVGTLSDSTLTARKIAFCRLSVVATPSYLDRAGEPRTPADLISHEVVVYDQGGGGATWTFRRGAAETSITVTGRLRVSAAEGVRAAVLSGFGLAIGSEWMFHPELRSGQVREVLRDWELPPVGLWVVFPTGRRTSAKARAFVAFIERQLGDLSAADAKRLADDE